MRGPVSLLKGAWDIFMSNPRLFLGIYLVPALIVFAWTLYVAVQEEEAFFTEPLNIILSVVLMAVLIAANILMGIAMVKAVANPTGLTVGRAYSEAKAFFWSYLWLALLVGIVTMVGFLFFVIPGIIFAIWFAFSYFILIFENKRGTDAMKASKAYVKGKWWSVLGRYAFLILIGILVSIVMGVVTKIVGSALEGVGVGIVQFLFNALIIPVAIGYSYLLYKDLSSTQAPTTMQTTVTPTSSVSQNLGDGTE